MAKITCQGITKVYPKAATIGAIDITIEDGEFAVVVGPSGCGKSTLLRMVAGLEEISAGELRIGERVVNTLEPKERDIAMVFQNYALYPHMSVYQNMAYGLKNRHIPKDEIRRRIDNAVNVLRLQPDMLKRKPGQLSGGQRQRVAMGRAIVREPQAFLFDEPLSNLDAKLRVQMRVEIKHLHALLGVTTLYVTHDQVEAMTLAQRLIVMNAGHVEQVGTPHELYTRPATLFVATFIGSPSMNTLATRCSDDGRHVEVGDQWHCPLPGGIQLEAGREAVVGIRPEHLDVGSTDDADITLPVDLVEDLGADILVHGQVAEQAFVARLPGRAHVTEGDRLPLKITGAIHLFDVQTGKRLEP